MASERGLGPSTHFSEQPPPLPVAQLEVGGAVPLNHLHGCQLLLPLGKGPGETGIGKPCASPMVHSILPCSSPNLPRMYPLLSSSSSLFSQVLLSITHAYCLSTDLLNNLRPRAFLSGQVRPQNALDSAGIPTKSRVKIHIPSFPQRSLVPLVAPVEFLTNLFFP